MKDAVVSVFTVRDFRVGVLVMILIMPVSASYIFPRSNAVGVPSGANPSPDDTDRFGCGHSDDGEAADHRCGTRAQHRPRGPANQLREGLRCDRRFDWGIGRGGACRRAIGLLHRGRG